MYLLDQRISSNNKKIFLHVKGLLLILNQSKTYIQIICQIQKSFLK